MAEKVRREVADLKAEVSDCCTKVKKDLTNLEQKLAKLKEEIKATQPKGEKLAPPPNPPKQAKHFSPSLQKGGRFEIPVGIIAPLTSEVGRACTTAMLFISRVGRLRERLVEPIQTRRHLATAPPIQRRMRLIWKLAHNAGQLFLCEIFGARETTGCATISKRGRLSGPAMESVPMTRAMLMVAGVHV
jgi:hypothetical protein